MKYLKKTFPILFLFFLSVPLYITAQVSVNQDNGDPDPSAILDVQSSDKGLLMPRMTQSQRDAIPNPVPDLMIYNVEESCFNYFTGENWIKDCGREDGLLPISQISEGGGGHDVGNAISTDAFGNSYLTGSFRNTATFGETTLTSSGSDDIFVAKTDPSGRGEVGMKQGVGYPLMLLVIVI